MVGVISLDVGYNYSYSRVDIMLREGIRRLPTFYKINFKFIIFLIISSFTILIGSSKFFSVPSIVPNTSTGFNLFIII